MLSWERDGYEISTDPSRIDVASVHEFLSTGSYWAEGRPRKRPGFKPLANPDRFIIRTGDQ